MEYVHVKSSNSSYQAHSQTRTYICLVPYFAQRESRHTLQVLLLVHLAIRLAIPRELILRIAEHLVNLVRLRVHPPNTLQIDNVLHFVESDGLERPERT